MLLVSGHLNYSLTTSFAGFILDFDCRHGHFYFISKKFTSLDGVHGDQEGKNLGPLERGGRGISGNRDICPPDWGNRGISGHWKEGLEDVVKALESGPWGPTMEAVLSEINEKPQQELVIAVLKRLKDVNVALNYFRWTERRINQVHCPEAYNNLLMVMARSRDFGTLEEVLEEMSHAGFGPSTDTCIEFVSSCVKSHRLNDCLLYTSPSPRDGLLSRMPSSA